VRGAQRGGAGTWRRRRQYAYCAPQRRMPPPCCTLARSNSTAPARPAAARQIVMRDRVTGKPRGFGFITFADEDAARRACEDTHVLDGRTVGALWPRLTGLRCSSVRDCSRARAGPGGACRRLLRLLHALAPDIAAAPASGCSRLPDTWPRPPSHRPAATRRALADRRQAQRAPGDAAAAQQKDFRGGARARHDAR
jgi:hypothetical protein